MDYRDGGAVERGEHVGALKLSIDHMAAKGMQGRGVMIDLERHCGRGESFVGYDQLMRIMEADKIEVEEGDLVCFRTGYDRVILGMNKSPEAAVLAANPGAGLDGRDERLLNWITKSGVVALISDNRAVEQMPSRPCEGEDLGASLPLHAHCLFKLGVYLGEIWYLSELADWLRAHGRSRFLLTAPPLRLPGAVGSPANEVATVWRSGVSSAPRSPPAGASRGTPTAPGAARCRESAGTSPRPACARPPVPAARSGSRHNRTAAPISALPAALSSSNCRPCRQRP